FDEDNWIDADIPQSAVRAAAKAEAEHLLEQADRLVWEAQQRAEALRACARALLATTLPPPRNGARRQCDYLSLQTATAGTAMDWVLSWSRCTCPSSCCAPAGIPCRGSGSSADACVRRRPSRARRN